MYGPADNPCIPRALAADTMNTGYHIATTGTDDEWKSNGMTGDIFPRKDTILLIYMSRKTHSVSNMNGLSIIHASSGWSKAVVQCIKHLSHTKGLCDVKEII